MNVGVLVFVWLCVCCSWACAQECNCWLVWQLCVRAFQELPDCFSRGSTVLHSHQQFLRVVHVLFFYLHTWVHPWDSSL